MPTAPFSNSLPFPVHDYDMKTLSVYSGAGGMDLGFSWAGFEPVWANDFFKDAASTYTLNQGDHMQYGDVTAVDLPDTSVDVVIGGPPCQGFSVAGKMNPDDPRSQHVFHFMKVIEQYMPQAFVMENVKALAENRKFELVREQLFEQAQVLGYHTSLFVLNAADYGVPQARERMFFVGSLNQPIEIPPTVTEHNRRTVRDALSGLPAYGTPGNDSLCRAVVTPAKNPVLRVSPYAGMLFNGAGRPLDLDMPSGTLAASMGGNRTPIIDQHQLEHGGESWVVEYHRRLRAGEPASPSASDHLRRLTVQEAAAIQTFPHDYIFTGSQSNQFRQIGNAVPPYLAYHVATAIRASTT